MKQRPYELVVFDWDGTLVDSIAGIVDCTRAACLEIDVEPPSRRLIRSSIGLGLDQSIELFFPETNVDARQLGEAYRRLWFAEFHAVSSPFVESAPLLQKLRGEDYLLAVATAKSRRGLKQEFERTGLGPYFHASRTADETVSKPHPAMLDELLEELGVTAQDVLMVGDTPHDLEMAENAGVDSVAVTGGAAAAENLAGYGALAVLAGVAGLWDWLSTSSIGSGSAEVVAS